MKIYDNSIFDISREDSKAGFIATLMSLLFFSLGFMYDNCTYWSNNHVFFLSINLPVSLIMAVSIVLLLLKKIKWSTLLIINYWFILVNLVLTTWYEILYSDVADYGVFSNMFIGFIIVITSAYTLKAKWSFIFSSILCVCFIGAAIYTKSPNLMKSVIIIPFVIIGTAFATHIYIQTYRRSLKRGQECHNEAERLRELMNAENKKVQEALEILNIETKETGNGFSKELKHVLKTINYNLPEVVLEYSQKLSSDENLFFNRLLKKYPTLTTSELKLCYMLIENMSTKEIAEATNCTQNSVKVFRSRLRKKLDLPSKSNLVMHLKLVEQE